MLHKTLRTATNQKSLIKIRYKCIMDTDGIEPVGGGGWGRPE
jgi:hypothetical protein